MDNMATGWDRPQEDEFALVALGAPTPYFRMAFPNDPPPYQRIFRHGGLSIRTTWSVGGGMKRVRATAHATKKGKRLLLKSPPHTGRIEELARLFPGAKFIHIVRDPYAILRQHSAAVGFARRARACSIRTIAIWTNMCSLPSSGCTAASTASAARSGHQLCELKYEDLVRDPLGQVRTIYQQLELGDFEQFRRQIEATCRCKKTTRSTATTWNRSFERNPPPLGRLFRAVWV